MSRYVLWIGLLAWLVPTGASAWEPLRSENGDVKRGNALMAEGQYAEALDAYDAAASELPESRGVQLNRGLALLAQGAGEQAKEAFVAAADPSADQDVRADAYYDLGVTFAREGDQLADKDEFEPAMANYREAVDAFKRALRIRPGDRDAAWNLEYALERIREQEEQQEQQQQDQEQEPSDEDQEPSDDAESQDQESESDSSQEQDEEQGEQPEPQDGQQPEEPPPAEGQGENQPPEQEASPEDQAQAEQPTEPSRAPPPRDQVERFLDALEQNEESLPVERARRQAAGRRKPEKDW